MRAAPAGRARALSPGRRGILRTAVVFGAVALAGCGGGRELVSYQVAKSRNTPDAYREFLFRYPHHPRAREIRDLLDAADFQKAARAHTAAAYRNYIRSHPKGNHVRRAMFLSQRIGYYDALSRNDTAALKQFLKRYPGSRYATEAESNLQRREFRIARKADTLAAYRAFLRKYRMTRSEYTAEAQQHYERLLLQIAKLDRDERSLARFVRDFPKSPYIEEARRELRRLSFERVLRSNDVKAWKTFLEQNKGTKEAAVIRRRMEEAALRAAERAGRVAALEDFLRRYPNSPHKDRIRSSISVMIQERKREAHRWIQVRNAEVEVFRPRKCARCKPVLKVRGTLVSTDAEFRYDLVLEAELIEGKARCCKTRHRVKNLRPGERRRISFVIPGKKPGSEPPALKLRVVEGNVFLEADAGGAPPAGAPGRKGKKSFVVDRFAPQAVPKKGR